jgi:hypothetical protein
VWLICRCKCEQPSRWQLVECVQVVQGTGVFFHVLYKYLCVCVCVCVCKTSPIVISERTLPESHIMKCKPPLLILKLCMVSNKSSHVDKEGLGWACVYSLPRADKAGSPCLAVHWARKCTIFIALSVYWLVSDKQHLCQLKTNVSKFCWWGSVST